MEHHGQTRGTFIYPATFLQNAKGGVIRRLALGLFIGDIRRSSPLLKFQKNLAEVLTKADKNVMIVCWAQNQNLFLYI
ncbi:MAG: hypothetical protein PHS34_06100 [Candidatus Omnitrophica bacterium]|nr:hypothetical protein [Candidatus Omnitrophota bacterium]